MQNLFAYLNGKSSPGQTNSLQQPLRQNAYQIEEGSVEEVIVSDSTLRSWDGSITDAPLPDTLLPFTAREIFFQIMFTTIATYVVTTEFGNSWEEDKSLYPLITAAIVAPFVMTLIEFFLNLTAKPKKDYDLHPLADAVISVALICEALVFALNTDGKGFNRIGYNAVVIIPAIISKIISEHVIAPYVKKHCAEDSVLSQYFYPSNQYKDAKGNIILNHHANRWYNLPTFLVLDFAILFCALIAGGELLGPYLTPIMESCGINAFAGIIAVSLVLNVLIGGTALWLGGTLKNAYPNYFASLLIMGGEGALFQAVSPLQDDTIGYLAANAVIAYGILFTLHSLGFVDNNIKKTPELIVKAPELVAYVGTKLGMYQPQNTDNQGHGEVLNPVVQNGPKA